MARLVRTVEDFCEDVGIGKTMFYKLAKTGKLKISKIGRKSVITDAAAEAFISSLPEKGVRELRPRVRKRA